MALSLRWVLAAVILALVALTGSVGLWAPADARLQDLRFAATSREPTGDIVFVDIDSASLRQVGVWPWPRSMHARLLDRLLALGAYEVAFDIDFSAASSAAEDAAFAASLAQAGGYAYLAAFRQVTADGREVLNAPIPEFARHARSVLVNVDQLQGGLVRAVPAALGQFDIASIASTFSPDAKAPGSIRIDYGIDLSLVPRVPVGSILDGSVDASLIRDRQVVVGASAIELNDRYATPRFGIVPGPLVQVAAAETLRQGRQLTAFGLEPALVAAGLLLAAGVFLRALRFGVALAVAAIVAVVVELSAFGLLAIWAVEVSTMPLHVALAACLLLRLLEDRAIRRRQVELHKARLAYLATHDERTGALSRAGWVEALGTELRLEGTRSILLIRMERLDATGASLGFDISEAATVLVHARLVAADLGEVGRVESDIFAVALRSSPEDATLGLVMERLKRPYEFEGHRVFVDMRWGLGSVSREDGAVLGLQRAHMALAAALRDNVPGLRYDDSLGAALDYRRVIDVALRDALGRGELDLVFQPQVDMRTHRISGVEALVRWTSAEHGPVSPATFIPLAEENGMMVQVGAWVAHEACRRAVATGWRGQLSINVSPIQFQQSDVVAMLESALDDTGFPAERLVVEITESLLVDANGTIVPALQRLRARGIAIAIDDFGTGYSSLSYLSGLPVDKLKIDQSFVRNLTTERGAGVLEVVASLGRRLGLDMIVEGVETREQRDYLAGIGCDTAQGYLFGKPAALADLLDRLDQAA